MNQIIKGIVIFILWTTVSIFGGWKINTYYQGYQNNLKAEVTQVVKDSINDMQADNARQLASTIQGIKDLDVRVVRESKTIVERPIYQNQCIDEDGIKLLKDFKDKSNALRN